MEENALLWEKHVTSMMDYESLNMNIGRSGGR